MAEWNKMLNFAIMKVAQVIFPKRLIVALLTLLGLFMPVRALSVDSLYVKFQNCDDNLKIALANDIFKELADMEFIDTLYSYDAHSRQTVVEANLHYWMAEYYYDKEQYAQSLEAISCADDLSAKIRDKRLRSDILSTMFNTYFRLGEYDKALHSLLECYSIDMDLGDDELISGDLNSFAAIYLAVKQPQVGIRYIERAIALERKLKRQDRLAIRLGMASELFLMNHEPTKAMQAIDEAYKIDSLAGRKEKAAIRLSQKGAVLEALSQYEQALAVMNRALPELEKANNTYSLAVCYNQLASVNEKLGNREAAMAYYKKALEQSVKCGSPKTERIAERGLWQTMRDENPAAAMIHLERYTALTDSLQSKMLSMQVGVMDLTAQSMNVEQMSASKRKINQALKWGGLLLLLMAVLMLIAMTVAWRKSRSVMQMQRKTQELKSHFFTNITNELQTPLTVIMNAGRHLLDNVKTSVEDRKQLGELIINHGNRMLGLVNQLLDIEAVKSGAEELPEKKTGDIVMFVRMLVDNHSESAASQLINLEFISSLHTLVVEFPLEYIRKIVHTLVDNAIKFTPRNGNVTVSLETPESGHVQLTVADTGKGIPENEIDRLFDPLSQSHENDDDGAGVSVGLALVKQIVQSMNGTIAVESQPNQGTTFTINFPVQVAKGDDDAQAADFSSFAEKRIRKDSKQLPLVFVVENNEDVAFFIASHLSDKYNLRLARDGREALQSAQDLVPDLIVTNMTMPVMDGWELIKRLRSTPTLIHIPIIAMTSSTSEQARMACFEAGADNVLVKPFNSGELRLVAEHLINQRSIIRDRMYQSRHDASRESRPEPMSKEDQQLISKLVEVIHAQMANDDIDMEHIAAALSLSPKQLRTRVMDITGMTLVAYVLQVRLNYARRLIPNESLSLTAISSKCGFQNLSYFSKTFKQQFGVSPQQYRKNLGEITAAPER